ncbi:MAG: DUF2975 domain-containing protein [Clostridia bacterium]|nr:DUF2975 domain-containing protein [Oscillospiraceae bacterium]MBQ3763251.1 DUF2975 domain-containing protein [Clostridia bacterium]
MKSLKTIQVLAKIGRIFSKIIFILCIVCFCICIVGLISLIAGFESFKVGGVTIRSIIENKAGLSTAALYTEIGVGMVLCASEAVLSKFAEIYFRNELADGTPFTTRGAKELKRLGILAIVIPICTAIVCSIGIAAVTAAHPEMNELTLDRFTSLGLGVMMIVTSVICRYGAELREEKTEESSAE